MNGMRDALLRANLVSKDQVQGLEASEKIAAAKDKFSKSPTLDNFVEAYPVFAGQFRLPLDTRVIITNRHSPVRVHNPSHDELRRMSTGYGTDLIGEVKVVKAGISTGKVAVHYPQPEDSGKKVEELGEMLNGERTITAVLTQLVDLVYIMVTL